MKQKINHTTLNLPSAHCFYSLHACKTQRQNILWNDPYVVSSRPKRCLAPPCVPPKRKCFWSIHALRERLTKSLCVTGGWENCNSLLWIENTFASVEHSVGRNVIWPYRISLRKTVTVGRAKCDLALPKFSAKNGDCYFLAIVSALNDRSTMIFSVSSGQTGPVCWCNSRHSSLPRIRRENLVGPNDVSAHRVYQKTLLLRWNTR